MCGLGSVRVKGKELLINPDEPPDPSTLEKGQMRFFRQKSKLPF